MAKPKKPYPTTRITVTIPKKRESEIRLAIEKISKMEHLEVLKKELKTK